MTIRALAAQIEEMLAQQKAAREAGDLGAIEKHGVRHGTVCGESVQRRAVCRSGLRIISWRTMGRARL